MPVTLYSNLAVAVPIWILFIGPVIFVIALSATLPQYYEVREDGLFIRQGWNKALLGILFRCVS